MEFKILFSFAMMLIVTLVFYGTNVLAEKEMSVKGRLLMYLFDVIVAFGAMIAVYVF